MLHFLIESMKRIKSLFGLCLLCLGLSQTGTMSGLIRDVATHQPLPGVNVFIIGTEIGGATNENGRYRIEGIPVGSFNVEVTMIGYEIVSRANVHIVPQRISTVNFDLHSVILQGEGVEVTVTYFEKTKDAVTSSRTVDIEEIRSDPIGAYDIMAMMQALPSVVSGADQTNEIIVRGGSPGENLFVMDFLEIPYPNHFPEQGQGGGPVTMVDTEFIERIDFYAGAFPARYGEKLSSVMDVTLREGNSENHLQQMEITMAGFGFTTEGPINETSNYIYSLKRSFLDFVISSSGLQAIPNYWSSQGKLTFHISDSQIFYVNFIGGIDEVNVEGENNPQLRGAENIDYSSWQSTFGMTYKNLFSRKGYLISSLGSSWVGLDAKVYEVNSNLERDYYFMRNDIEGDLSFRSELVYQLRKGLDLSCGLTAKYIHLNYDNWFEKRPVTLFGYSLDTNEASQLISEEEFYTTYFENPNTILTELGTVGELDSIKTNRVLAYKKLGGFFHINWITMPKTELLLGGRLDYISFTKASSISPRFGLKYHLSPFVKFNLSAGRYYQTPFNNQLNSNRGATEYLRNYFTDQWVGGIEFLPKSDLRITLEYFEKEYEDMVIFEMLRGSDGKDSLNYNKLINGGQGRSKGIELFIQKKYSKNWYGSISWSHSISEGVDPRTNLFYPWDFDYRNVINIVGGYKIRYADYSWFKSYKNSWISKGFSWLPFMPSDEFEISLKYRLMGGRPYTPLHYDPTTRDWYSNSDSPWNTSRYGYYSRLDLMLLQRFHFKGLNLVVFWDIINILNRENPFEYVYLEDGSKLMGLQYTTMPIGGMILEF